MKTLDIQDWLQEVQVVFKQELSEVMFFNSGYIYAPWIPVYSTPVVNMIVTDDLEQI